MRYIAYLLFRFINGHQDLTNKTIALNLLENIHSIPKSSLNEMADLCFVSPSSLSRFCKIAGLQNYSNLRSISRLKEDRELKVENSYFDKANQEHYELLIKQNIQLTVSMEDIDCAVKMIHDANNIIFFGSQISQLLAMNLQAELILSGRFSEAAVDLKEQYEACKTLKEGDLAILTSLHGNFFRNWYNIFDEIVRSKCRILIITQQMSADILKQVDKYLICGCSDEDGEGKYAILRTYDIISRRYACIY